MSYWSPKKQQPIVDLMPLIAMKQFHKEPKRPIGLVATLVVSNIVCISVACLLWGTTWASTKMGVLITEIYAKERSKWAQTQNEQALAMENLNAQIARLVGLQTSSPSDVLQLAQKISSVLDTANGTQRKFLEQALPHAIRIQVQYGIPASVTIAQAAYESSWGRSKLAVKANNFFGIKANHWNGDRINMDTKDLGVATRADFRVYKDVAAGFQGYADFLKENPRYGDAFYTKSGEAFLSRILAAGYCPTPSYAAEVKDIMQRYNLAELDDLLKQGANAPYQVALNKKSTADAN
jgi:flagellar protein FlgJ